MLLLMALIGCGVETVDTEPPPPFSVSVPSVLDDGTLPVEFSCDGDDLSPEVRWEGVPDGTAELLLVVDDPDAPGVAFLHWLAWGLPDDGLAEGATGGESLIEGTNGFGNSAWGGPCPPEGQTHTYVFRLSALSAELELEAGATRADVNAASEGLVLEQVQATGVYTRLVTEPEAD